MPRMEVTIRPGFKSQWALMFLGIMLSQRNSTNFKTVFKPLDIALFFFLFFPNIQASQKLTPFRKVFIYSLSLSPSGNASTTTPNVFTATTAYSPFYIGDTGAGKFNGGFNGSVANAQLYNTALSHTQIQQLFSEGMGGSSLSNAGLVGWWPLDGNANDYSGNNNNGVATNVQWVSP